MQSYFSILIALLLFAGCSTSERNSDSNDSVSTSMESSEDESESLNTLTDTETKEGWRLLFDGRSMDGWRAFKNQQNNSWEVSNGTLHCKPFNDNGDNHRSDLITKEQFKNFDLRFEWRITPQANTGVMYHVTEELNETYMTGPEYQIVDDDGYPGEMVDTQKSGAVYHMYAPSIETKLNPIGEWNDSRIVVNNNHAEHWLNGVKIAAYAIQSDDWKSKIASSKWKDFPRFGIPENGHIALQDHRNEVWFRNLKIRTF